MCRSSSVAVSLFDLAHCPQRLDANGAPRLLQPFFKDDIKSVAQRAAASSAIVVSNSSVDRSNGLNLSFCLASPLRVLFSFPLALPFWFTCSHVNVPPHASVFFFLPPPPTSSRLSAVVTVHSCIAVVLSAGGGLGEGLLGSRGGEGRSGGCVVDYVAAPARWRYAPPPHHTVVSAAVAACAVTGEGVGLMTYLYSCHLSKKEISVWHSVK